MLEDENCNTKADYEAKIEEVKTFRMLAKEKFELEKELSETKAGYEKLKIHKSQSEEEQNNSGARSPVMAKLETTNEKLHSQNEVVGTWKYYRLIAYS